MSIKTKGILSITSITTSISLLSENPLIFLIAIYALNFLVGATFNSDLIVRIATITSFNDITLSSSYSRLSIPILGQDDMIISLSESFFK